MTRVLTVPGWQGSGPGHWQSLWERLDATVTRVEQADWEHPDAGTWALRLGEALAADPRPTVLVAHSLGCHVVARLRPAVLGALLVAPPDLEAQPLPGFGSFLPVPRAPLPFPAVVVGSSDDPWSTSARTRQLAQAWGARFVDVGPRGHLNSGSGLGTWPEGRELLRGLRAAAPFTPDARLVADTHLVGRSALCELRLFDDARYPWLVLVPCRSAVEELSQLAPADQAQLAQDSLVLAGALGRWPGVDKVNVGALGNVVRQLHVHHVGRSLGDAAWPGPVWGHSPRQPRRPEDREAFLCRLFDDAVVAAHFTRA